MQTKTNPPQQSLETPPPKPKTPRPNSPTTWTSLITQLWHFNKHLEGLICFDQMMSTAVHANAFTFSSVSTACANTLVVVNEKRSSDLVLARKVFDEMPERKVVSLNSTIVGCLRNEMFDMAIGACFVEAIREGFVSPESDQVNLWTTVKIVGCLQTLISHFIWITCQNL